MAAGTPRHIADNVAEILVQANLTGHDSHGVLRIPSYLTAIAEGRLAPAAEPTPLKEAANALSLDGGNGFGHYTAWTGMKRAIEKAKQADVCCVSFSRTNHIGRLGHYAEAAARAGCVSIITHGSAGRSGQVVPFGGARGILSTNPIAFGVPTGDAAPFILDIATSVVAEGKLQVARSKGENVPEGYIVDQQGRPTTRTLDFYEGGFLLPFGKHKGYGLGLVIALLGGLAGSFDPDSGAVTGEFMQVINVEAFTPLAAYQRQVRAFLDEVKAIPPAPGFDEVLVPGDFEARMRASRLAQGIDIPTTIHNQLQEWATRLQLSLDQLTAEPADLDRYQ
jgi:LDH2 family malate/lactate/ureidoglycolate dehydrogenase